MLGFPAGCFEKMNGFYGVLALQKTQLAVFKKEIRTPWDALDEAPSEFGGDVSWSMKGDEEILGHRRVARSFRRLHQGHHQCSATFKVS